MIKPNRHQCTRIHITKKFCSKVQDMVKKKCHRNDYEDVSQEVFIRIRTINTSNLHDGSKYLRADSTPKCNSRYEKKGR